MLTTFLTVVSIPITTECEHYLHWLHKVLKVNTDPVLEFGAVHNWAVTDIFEERTASIFQVTVI